MASGPQVWVCELQGNDEEGLGTEKMPYKNSMFALEKAATTKISILIRKDLIQGFQPIAKAAFKKLVKGYEVNVKKAKKAAEKAQLDAQEALKNAEADKKKLEEAKKIVLVQDASLPAAKKVID